VASLHPTYALMHPYTYALTIRVTALHTFSPNSTRMAVVFKRIEGLSPTAYRHQRRRD